MNDYKVLIDTPEKKTLVNFQAARTRKQKGTYQSKSVPNLRQTARDEIAYSYEDGYNGGGGGGDMDDLRRKVQQLEDEIKVIRQDIKEKPSKTDFELLLQKQTVQLMTTIPNEDRIKTIISEQFRDLDIATKTYVKGQISESSNKNFRWTLGLGIPALVAIALALLKLYFT